MGGGRLTEGAGKRFLIPGASRKRGTVALACIQPLSQKEGVLICGEGRPSGRSQVDGKKSHPLNVRCGGQEEMRRIS